MQALQEIFLSPFILFFILGIVAGAANSDLKIPEQLTKTIALILMLTIGLKGGSLLRVNTVDLSTCAGMILMGIISGILLPYIGFWLLRSLTSTSAENAASLAAYYGSVSIVTFTFATQFLEGRGYAVPGYMMALTSIMEIPAILVGLFIASKFRTQKARISYKAMLKDSFLNSSVVLLLGGLFIGLFSEPSKFKVIQPFFIGALPFMLCLFLLETGLLIARQERNLLSMPKSLIVFALCMPLVGMAFGLLSSKLVGVGYAERVIFTVLCASASYIAVPAAMRLAIPEADHEHHITCSLGITFPFNIFIGVPLYAYLADVI